MTDLKSRRCVPCEGGVPPLDLAAATRLQKSLHARWKLIHNGERISATFEFSDYWRTHAFVSAVACASNRRPSTMRRYISTIRSSSGCG